MSKKTKKILSVIGVLMVLFSVAFIHLLSVRGEFKKHLQEKYAEKSFIVGFTEIEFIYGKYYSKVICLDDDTSFGISKSFKTKNINED